ncbi:MAG: transglycosylase SLT domain-containing protein [Granulosicoccaceae bacterium]|jgi:soluble lytic murein transglycosylase
MARIAKMLFGTGLLLALMMGAIGVVHAADRVEQRKDFLEARKAIREGALTKYNTLLARLDDYPLRPYLEYEYLKRRLHKRTHTAAVRAFLEQQEQTPVGRRLRGKWLQTLAKQGRWQAYLDDYRDLNSTTLDCYRARAMQNTRHAETDTAVLALWQIGKSQPRACDKVFDTWRAQGKATPTAIWQRIRLAMHKRKPNLARYLAKFLGPEEREWVERWRRMYRQPAKMLGHKNYRDDTPLVREIVLHGLERLARIDAGEAAKRWAGIRQQYSFTDRDRGRIQRTIALHAATQRLPEAWQLFDAVPAEWRDEKTHTWRVRSALNMQDWQAVERAVQELPESMRLDDDWQYWQARAEEQTGRTEQARQRFAVIANEASYHGFLAADRLKLPYTLDGQPIAHTNRELDALASRAGFTRAYELYQLGMTVDARREWQAAIKPLQSRELELAAVLAHRWGWHDRAVLTAGRAGHYTDLRLRFPIVFEKQVLKNAKTNRIDPAWVFSILRQESAYMTDARSHAGALGLMQLMPRTARSEAKRLKLRVRNQYEILHVDNNIQLGTAHLKSVLERHNGHLPLATAAYNAGSYRVRSWLPEIAAVPADVWIETVPFNETRKYVKKIMATTAIFEKHLDQPVTPLQRRMPDIAPRS